MFDETHTIYNISQLMYLILEEYRLISKIFLILFDNISSNIISIVKLKIICQLAISSIYLFFYIEC